MVNGKNRLQQAQGDVEEVTVIMVDNFKKAQERDFKLGELEDRSDELYEQSKAFEKTTAKLKQKKRWESKKIKVVSIGVGVVAAIIIFGLIIFAIVYSTRAQ
ncbi:vesicle-associated membrane protein 5-like [Pungitius pungitius]|uniref:vesicle-associated membrane protein 5-like n=1 Tax=Pungitius pungitius TaxID=134920 RepID=UPI002E109237